MGSDKPKILVSAAEQTKVARAVRAWLQTCPDKPVKKIDFEYLPEDEGLTMSTVQAVKTRQYILGGYEAQYTFRLVLRGVCEDTDQRLAADEALDLIGEWAETDGGLTIAGATVRRVRRDSGASILARYEDGTEDHQVQISIIYEVT